MRGLLRRGEGGTVEVVVVVMPSGVGTMLAGSTFMTETSYSGGQSVSDMVVSQ